jgi:hypothetical protein
MGGLVNPAAVLAAVLSGIALATFAIVAVPSPQPSRVVVRTGGPRRTPSRGERSHD